MGGPPTRRWCPGDRARTTGGQVTERATRPGRVGRRRRAVRGPVRGGQPRSPPGPDGLRVLCHLAKSRTLPRSGSAGRPSTRHLLPLVNAAPRPRKCKFAGGAPAPAYPSSSTSRGPRGISSTSPSIWSAARRRTSASWATCSGVRVPSSRVNRNVNRCYRCGATATHGVYHPGMILLTVCAAHAAEVEGRGDDRAELHQRAPDDVVGLALHGVLRVSGGDRRPMTSPYRGLGDRPGRASVKYVTNCHGTLAARRAGTL
jgi:hypothetical protein